MANKPKPVNKVSAGLTRTGDLYVQGDKLPVPDMEEKNTDSVWALWSDLVDENPRPELAEDDKKPSDDRDFLETVPLDLNAMAETQLMGLPEERKK